MSDFHLLPDEPRPPVSRHPRKLSGQKLPLKPKEVWAIRIRLQIQGKPGDLALFNLAIDSKLRSCDGEYCALPRNRGGRCITDIRTN